jgi:hypothetical protein
MLVNVLLRSPSVRGKAIALRLRPAAPGPDLPLTRLRHGLYPGCTPAKLPAAGSNTHRRFPHDASTNQRMARRWRDQR